MWNLVIFLVLLYPWNDDKIIICVRVYEINSQWTLKLIMSPDVTCIFIRDQLAYQEEMALMVKR